VSAVSTDKITVITALRRERIVVARTSTARKEENNKQ